MNTPVAYNPVEMSWNAALMVDDLEHVRQLWTNERVAGKPYQDINGHSRAHAAAHYGAEKCLVWILEQHPQSVHLVDNQGETVLHRAAYSGNPWVVQVLLDKGAQVSAKTRYFATALHYAAHRPNDLSAQVIEKLLKAGADETQIDYQEKTARQWAESFNVVWPSSPSS